MAKCEVISVDNFIKDIDARSKDFKNIAGASLYKGAAILADELRKNIEALPERPRSEGSHEGPESRSAEPHGHHEDDAEGRLVRPEDRFPGLR